jgi:uncharacterized protein (TIGR02001 family)
MKSPGRLPVALLTLAALLPATSAHALDGSVDLSVQSAYIWRGMVVDDKPVFQPSITVSDGGLSASVWGNLNLTADNGYKGEASEMDYWLAYTLAGKDVDWTLTYYAYTFPHTMSVSTQEVWANVTFKNVPFAPSFTAIRDVNAVKGWYFLLTGSQNLGVLTTNGSDGLLLTLNVGHGNEKYTRAYFPQLHRESVTDFGVRLDWPLKMGPGTLKLGVGYTNFTDADVSTPGFEDERANVVVGLGYSLAF